MTKRIIKLNIFILILISINFGTVLAKNFSILSVSDFGDLDKIRFQDGRTSRVINLERYKSNISYPVPDHDLIHFYELSSETNAKAKKPLFYISFNNQETDSIILLKNDPNKGKISYKFINNNIASFPPSSALILNFSKNNIVSEIGGTLYKILPNSKNLIRLSKNEKGTFLGYAKFANKLLDNKINYFYHDYWRVIEGRKYLCIIEEKADGELSLNRILF